MNIDFVNERIAKEIKAKLARMARIDGHSGISPLKFILGRLHEACIKKEAILHSYKMEYPNGNGNGYNHNAPKGKKRIKKGFKNHMRAFSWGYHNFDPERLNETFVKTLAHKIDPNLHKGEAEYRTFAVRPSGATWTPPYPEKIPKEISEFLFNLRRFLRNREDAISTLNNAIYAHFHLVRIHPFEDTNGRTARTLQNIILRSDGLPPPVIYTGEREDYQSHLDAAINGWRTRTGSRGEYPSPEEASFYDYIAGKVSASLDRI